MILVTGATGTVGSEVVRQLIAAGEHPRLLVRSPEKAKAWEGKAELFKGDLDDAAAVAKALEGADKLFLLTAGLDGHRLESEAIDAAKAAGVKHVVKLSVLGAEYESISFAKWHRANEKKLEASGLKWTFLRPGNFDTNSLWWAESIKQDGAVYHPVGHGKSAVIDPVDIGAVAVKALTTSGHEGKVYVLTGPVALTTQEQVDLIGKAIGKSLKHVDVAPEAAREGMLKAGMPEGYVNALLELYAATKAGQTALQNSTVEEVLGRKAGSFEAFVARHLAAFQ
jgi:(4-alkanoyl-5-oxo-2,5-dihydrofuran-3-yl)methyl phosphate reductase